MKSNKFFSSTAIYLSSSVLSGLLPILLLPTLTKYLSPSEFGIIAMFQVVVGLFSSFVGGNTNGAILRQYYHEDCKRMFSLYVNTCFSILFFTLIATVLVVFIFKGLFESISGLSFVNLMLAIAVSFWMFIIKVRLSQYQASESPLKYACIQFPNSIINLSFTLLLILCFEFYSQGRILAIVIAATITGGWCFYSLIKQHKLKFTLGSSDFYKDALSYGLKITPHILGVFLLAFVDRFIIVNYMGLESAGIYMVAIQLCLAISMLFDAMNKAYVPLLFKTLKRNSKEDKVKVVKSTYIYIFIVLVFSILAYQLSPLVVSYFVDEKYHEIGMFIGLLCIAQSFNGIYLVFTNYLIFTKKTGVLSAITISSGLFNALLSMFLISYYGLIGVAVSCLLSSIIRCLLTFISASKVYKMPWGLTSKLEF